MGVVLRDGPLGQVALPAYLALGTALAVLVMATSFELDRFGPVALINPPTFPYERTDIPWRALGEAGLFGAFFLSLGLSLGLLHEGSMAEVLARRASAREVAGFWALLFAALIAVSWAAERREHAPFEFTNTSVLRSAKRNVQVMYAFPALEARAQSVLSALEELAARLDGELGVGKHPALRVSHNALLQGADPRAASAAGSGVLLELNLGAPVFDRERLLAAASHDLFLSLSRKRAAFEPNHWFLDGFSAFWLEASDGPASAAHWLSAAILVRRHGFDADAIRRWELVMEQTGEQPASSLAYTLVAALERRHGRERMLELARVLLVRPSVENVADWLEPTRRDFSRLFEQRAGEPWTRFVKAWRQELAARAGAADLEGKATRVPDDRAELAAEQTPIGGDVVYRLSGPPLERSRACSLLHVRLEPYDRAILGERLSREAIAWESGSAEIVGRLRGRYQRGQRLFAAVECDVPELVNPLRLTARRLEVP